MNIDCLTQDVATEMLEENSNICPYHKRKKVKRLKEVHKWVASKPKFTLLQHAQHTIADINENKNVIESMVNDFYIRYK